MKHALKRDYIWNTAGVLTQNILSPLLLVLIAIVNGVHEVGLFSYAFAVSVLLWSVALWGGRTYQVSDTKHEFNSNTYLLMRSILASVALLLAVLFCVANGYDWYKSMIICTLVGMRAIESVADMLHGVLQCHDRLYIAGKLLVTKAIIGPLAFLAIDIATEDILLASAGMVGVVLVITALGDWRQAKVVEPSLGLGRGRHSNSRDVSYLLLRSAPVFVATFFAMLTLNIPRYYLDLYHEDLLGYFGIMAMPVTLIVMLMSFILQPQVLQLSKLIADNNLKRFSEIIRNILGITCGLGVGIAIITWFIGPWALELLFHINFESYRDELMIITIGAILNALVGVFINLFIIIRHLLAPVFILGITNVILAIAGFFVVSQEGLLGGVKLFAVASAVQVILFIGEYVRWMIGKKGVEIERN